MDKRTVYFSRKPPIPCTLNRCYPGDPPGVVIDHGERCPDCQERVAVIPQELAKVEAMAGKADALEQEHAVMRSMLSHIVSYGVNESLLSHIREVLASTDSVKMKVMLEKVGEKG